MIVKGVAKQCNQRGTIAAFFARMEHTSVHLFKKSYKSTKMKSPDRKKHWENIYQTKDLKDTSWYQPIPTTSLDFLNLFKISKTGKIIDVGGGDSLFVDHLLELGYQDVTVLDISASALERAKNRLGEKANMVNWIIADAATFTPTQKYDFWHDRAALHFLTQEDDIENYIQTIKNGLSESGALVLGTFSKEGPTKCSGIDIKQYSEESMTSRLEKSFNKVKCVKTDHETPFGTLQNFIFCSFKKV
jgi:SAM-dependent methyltransferase